MNKELNHSMKKAALCSVVQFVSFVGLIILANAGLRSFLETRTDFEPLVQVAIRIVILVVLIALVYPQFRKGCATSCCSKSCGCGDKRCNGTKMMHKKKAKDEVEESEEKPEEEMES